MKRLVASLLAVATMLAGMGPANAVPTMMLRVPAVSQDVTLAQHRPPRREVRRPGRPGWHNGHRGYRSHRPGYRRHSDGWWYPLAAFGLGMAIGGAAANQPPARLRNVDRRHFQWCAARYRTYRASDNTYVPRVGVRAQCRSPYYR